MSIFDFFRRKKDKDPGDASSAGSSGFVDGDDDSESDDSGSDASSDTGSSDAGGGDGGGGGGGDGGGA